LERTYFIIDDDLLQNEIQTILLKKVDPQAIVYSFTSSLAALAVIDKGSIPDLIFLDLHIPGEETADFLEIHRERNCPADIYLMSSVAYMDDPHLFDEYPAIKDFISKPLLDYKLRAILSQFV